MLRATTGLHVMLIMVVLACAASLTAQKADNDTGTENTADVRGAIWRDPGSMGSLNLLYGAGGKAHAPDARGRFTFIREDSLATSPKFDIADQRGVEWKVKLGDEPQSETAASRLLWATGYFVDEDSIYEVGGERRYVVTDLGASFGNTGNSLTRSKSAPQEYADSKFVERATSDFIDFVLHSRPFILSAVNVPNYQTRTRMEEVAKKVPRADATWLGRRLSMLSDKQIRDCFGAAGYTPREIGVYTQAVRKRTAELIAL